MTTKHTPGPWKAQEPRGHQRAINRKWEVISKVYGGELVIVGEHTGVDCLKEADARLIAAAPELLTALEDLIYALDRNPNIPVFACGEAREVARAAIAKTKS